MADLNKLKNVVNAIVSEDTKIATENLNSFLAELTKEILGEAKKCDDCESSEEFACDCGKTPCECKDKCKKCGKKPCTCKVKEEECEMS